MQLHDIVETSRRVGEAPGRLDKIRELALCLSRAEPGAIATAVALLSGEPRQGRIGIGPAAVYAAMPAPAAAGEPSLTLAEIDAAFTRIAGIGGAGSSAERARRLGELFARATRAEQDFLARAILGELRQGALEGLLVEAVAEAAAVPAAEVRRALMVMGALAPVAEAALTRGRPALDSLATQLFRPLKPMLAQTAEDPTEALARLGAAAFEYKLDGVRIQVHKEGSAVRFYSRALNEVTASVPELVEVLRGVPADSAILDGEAIALRPDGMPQPFQVTMRRFGRKLDVEVLRAEIPLRPVFFDCLYLNGEAMLDRPAAARFAALAEAVPSSLAIPRLVTADPAAASAFLDAAVAHGHEGVMAKALDAPYEAGGRGRTWLKIKPAVTLDLVVLAAEWGHGRRTGRLSNLHLGARDPATGGFVMLGKTFKGLTDELLDWQTAEFQKIAVARDHHTVHLQPKLVVEIAFNEVQASPRYPGGLALRFARVKGYRPDKTSQEADTIDTVRVIYQRRLGSSPP